ncbi:type III-A CRISPR-associated RAMP protein Csm5 [Thermococcus sp. LS2]|uniref:type III-A CRISPR-associated RAMP protein Csm5 n=1 Tax=Thermococcus sp. LS2 TaxID=1638260 RepID=UPI00143A93CB|nr:type III-A CRISPR-associated RAMP protein Csm5 [Thermococcus sp. LS2]NJE13348.1 type III-A CRISPR-associated RAMP protein Csm5 [Thermococcus sp. LS2]
MKLEVLSPLHIGSGETLTPADFVIIDDEVIVLDLDKLISALPTEDIDEILETLKSVPYPWEKILARYHLNARSFEKYSLKLIGKKRKESMQIKAFIKSNGKPFIPGSSIKGAMKTAVMYKVVKENRWLLNQAVNWLDSNIHGFRDAQKFMKKADDWLEAKIFGSERKKGKEQYEPKRDPFKAVIVRDSECLSLKHLKVYGVEIVGESGGIPTYVEGIEDITVTFDLNIQEDVLRLNVEKFNGKLKEVVEKSTGKGFTGEAFMEFIQNALSEFYTAVIKTEIREIHKYGRYKGEVFKFYQELQAKIENGAIPIRIGWGSGWYSTTIGVLLKTHPRFENPRKKDDLRRKLGLGRNPKTGKVVSDFPKTRRVANGKPMGWCLVKF